MPVMVGLSARFPLRALMALGALAGGCVTFFLGFSHNIWVFTGLFTVVWVSTQACGGVVGNALVSNWFSRYRGRAFGLVNAGTSLSGAVLPLIALPLINTFGMQTAYMILGAATLLLAPASWLLIRDTPEEMGLHPDGSPSAFPPQHHTTRALFYKNRARSPSLCPGNSLRPCADVRLRRHEPAQAVFRGCRALPRIRPLYWRACPLCAPPLLNTSGAGCATDSQP
ncbi:MFS transporter [Candidatus Desulfovibrio trichonymphae]|uniref:MFS transporter n=1 Tax=Candidatus Desulfovibrio trichonymphae TaxID=1725232 RepID=UPI001E561A4C|nr:MFS transporter [Candidatus Desulfovibrio trichonymphae]